MSDPDSTTRQMHLLSLPNSAVGHTHTLRAWIDRDRDREHDPGEPSHEFTSDFTTRPDTGTDPVAPEPAMPTVVEIVETGGDRISRAGQWSEFRFRLNTTTQTNGTNGSDSVTTRRILPNTPIGVSVLAGPSRGVEVMCARPPTNDLPDPGYSSRCVTDTSGELALRFKVPPGALSALARQTDTLRIWLDRDTDGIYDSDTVDENNVIVTPEPAQTTDIPIAKAVNYVAIGDSYSSGEAGDFPPTGLYQLGISPADPQCRRWVWSYPEVFAREVFARGDAGVDVAFQTIACTGAIINNVHNSLDPGNDSTTPDLIATRRPSKHAPAVGEPGWEPRQAVSLANAQDMASVDMITITIGGNDAGFESVLRACVLGGRDCSTGDLADAFDEIPARLSSLLAELKRVAPDASIFLLGYPHVTPSPIEINRILIEHCGQPGRPLHATGIQQSPIVSVIHHALGGTVGDSAISYSEARLLWDSGIVLNDMLRRAAVASDVHFVDVSGIASDDVSARGFFGHSPCNKDPWLNGFVSSGELIDPQSARSFHPNRAGHRAYAIILADYISNLVRAGARLAENGLPANPAGSK